MAQRKFIAYYRVGTQKQGHSGLGIDAQKATVATYLKGTPGWLVGEYIEVETGKATNALERRPELRAALAQCKRERATLVIAKLDRLARSLRFVTSLIETGVSFIAADMPHADKTMLHHHAVMSEWERDAISRRTKEALARAKARGVKLGVKGYANLKPNIEYRRKQADAYADTLRDEILGLCERGLSQRAIVERLNSMDVKAPRGGRWYLPTLQRVMARVSAP